MFELTVVHHLRTHTASSMLEQWIEVTHDESAPIRLHDYDSVAPFMLVPQDAEICQFGGGGWADEWRWTTERLTPGTKVLGSLGGVQPHLQRSPCLLVSPTGPTTEHHGQVLGLSIAWGGNTQFALDVRPTAGSTELRDLRIRAGANPYGADYVLDPGSHVRQPDGGLDVVGDRARRGDPPVPRLDPGEGVA